MNHGNCAMKNLRCRNCKCTRFRVLKTKYSIIHECVKCKQQHFFTKHGLRRKKVNISL